MHSHDDPLRFSGDIDNKSKNLNSYFDPLKGFGFRIVLGIHLQKGIRTHQMGDHARGKLEEAAARSVSRSVLRKVGVTVRLAKFAEIS